MPPLFRPARPDDYAAFVTLHRELGMGDTPPPPERWRAEIAPGSWVAELDGTVAGYVYFQALKDAGYVRSLAVLPAFRRQGLARALMGCAARALKAAGAERWRLNVLVENTAATRLYEALGLRPLHRSVVTRFTWALVERLPPGAEPCAPSLVSPDTDPEVEAAFALPGGTLANARKKQGERLLVQLRDPGGRPCGIAVFDPDFPGAFPFRVATPTLARPLLEALRPYRRPGVEQMGLVVEDDDDLAAMLVDAGATVRARMVHYEGPLPEWGGGSSH